MDYIYDIVLNFQNNYYDFYEWKSSDKVINVKKILVYKINNQDYLNLKYNDVILDTKLLPQKIKRPFLPLRKTSMISGLKWQIFMARPLRRKSVVLWLNRSV